MLKSIHSNIMVHVQKHVTSMLPCTNMLKPWYFVKERKNEEKPYENYCRGSNMVW